jgi:Rv0078B-related antitoxin
MSPDAAVQAQIERYRRMTGQERLNIALDLHEFACEVSRAGIRRQFAGAADEEVERQLRRRIQMGRV